MSRRTGARLAGIVLACAMSSTLVACVPASPDPQTYQDRTVLALETALSQVGTVELVVRERGEGDIMRAYAVSVARDSESAASTAADSYAALEPPRTADPLYESTSKLLGDSGDLLTRARIALVRDDGDYDALLHQLDTMASDLESAEERLR